MNIRPDALFTVYKGNVNRKELLPFPKKIFLHRKIFLTCFHISTP